MAANLKVVGFNPVQEFESWLETLREHLLVNHPDLVTLFDVFANEAVFGRRWLSSSLDLVPQGARILEVGGGLMLLSCQLAREGFKITVIEPVGEGFSSFSALQEIVLSLAKKENCSPVLLQIPVEQFEAEASYDFAFSINVMEHIKDVRQALTRVCSSLRPGSTYRFTCPNYLFPYEPHFNIPTLFSKSWTERLLHNQIIRSKRVSEPMEMWRSLNWINVIQIQRICASLIGATVKFSTGMLAESLERVTKDTAFASRRSKWVLWLANFLVATRLHRLTSLLPPVILPVIDCTVTVRA